MTPENMTPEVENPQNTPESAPQNPVPAKPKKKTWMWIGLGCLGLFFLGLVVIGIIIVLVAVGIGKGWSDKLDSWFGKDSYDYDDDETEVVVDDDDRYNYYNDSYSESGDQSEFDWMAAAEAEPEEIVVEEVAVAEPAATQAVTDLVIVNDVEKETEIKDVKEVVNGEPVVQKPKEEGPVSIAMVEQKPLFPGGEAAMYKWLGEHINYPASASERGIQGKVSVQFIVEKDGSLSNVHVLRGKDPDLDREAVRVVSTMPKWTPGRNNGQTVRVTYNLPITFRLQN